MALPLFSLQGKKKDQLLAVDLGSRTTKAIHLQSRGDGLALMRYAVLDAPVFEKAPSVELLADHFLRRFAAGRPLTLSPAAREWLRTRTWPGNIRELEHTLERAVLLARDTTIEPADLEDRDPLPPRLALGSLAGLTLREMERRLILDTLKRTNDNRTHAARLLGISIRTLRNKLSEYRQRGELELPAMAV